MVIIIVGNTPAHWAAQNGKLEALKYLIDHYDVNVLAQNSAGRSILTEAFQSGNTDCIAICLSHDSASEEKLIDLSNNNSNNNNKSNVDSNSSNESSHDDIKANFSNYNNEDNLNNDNSCHSDNKMDFTSTVVASTTISAVEENHAVIHTMLFDGDLRVKIRELPITNPDDPFGSDIRPEDDTTGLSLWPASIILAHWVAKIGLLLSRQNNNESSLKNESSSNESLFRRPRVVLELGAGCGLPGIVAGIGLQPDVVYITDIHKPTLKNAEYNVQLNEGALVCEDSNKILEQRDDTDVIMSDDDYSDNRNTTNNKTSTTTTHVIRMDWTTIASYPCEKVDLLLGSDLVYDINILSILVPTICYLLHADGSFLYVAPDTGRQGREIVVVCAIYHQAIIIIIMATINIMTTIIIMISSSCYQ